ncbi:10303_t:CDS:10, partial [Gigaspora rosea]
MDPQAIEALTQLGVSEDKAIEALKKFNGNVERAANFIYENMDNNMSTDPEETSTLAPLGSDSQNDNWGDGGGSVLGCFDRQNDSSSLENDRVKAAMEASMADKEKEDLQKAIDMSKTDSYAGALIPYNDQNWYNNNNDWDQPAKRQKLDTTHFFQALFHIPVFRLSLLAFRPTKDDWGNVEGYWKGQKHYNFDDSSKLYSSTNRQESLKFIHEFQKLFGFLSLSQRTYGDSSLLMDVLDFDEKGIWNEVETVCNFTNKLIGRLMEGSYYRDPLRQNTPHGLQNYILDFEKFNIYPSCHTIYDALDRVMQESRGNSRESTFQVLKEIYMDRYTAENSEFIETCWQKIEEMKEKLEKINQNIDKIMKFQGKYNGPDLLKGSIDHFQQKYNKAEENGASDNDSLQTKAWLENFLNKVEQKLK